MLSVKEFMQSLDKNQFVLKIIVQKDNFTNQNYANNCHIPFDDDSIRVINCKVSAEDYLFIIGITETVQEVKLFWDEQHFVVLKNTEPCDETIFEFKKLKQPIRR